MTHQRAATIIARYPQSRSALLPLLHLVQSEEGCVSVAGLQFCAGHLGLESAEVAAVASFYTMYKRTPCGEHLVSVCTNTLCAVLGGDAILSTLSRHLGVAPDETAGVPGAPGSITLEHAECLAACDHAPVSPSTTSTTTSRALTPHSISSRRCSAAKGRIRPAVRR